VGGYPSWLTIGEDYYVYIRLCRAGWRFAYVDSRSAVYRWSSPTRGASYDRRRQARQRVKLFVALSVQMPRTRTTRASLGSALKELVATYVPGSLTLWQHMRTARRRLTS
jgi:hypothetical protein